MTDDLPEMPDEVRRILAASWGKRRMCLPPSELAGNWDALLLPYDLDDGDGDHDQPPPVSAL